MAIEESQLAKCFVCGFEAPAASDDWNRADHPPIGSVVQCPECGSTKVHSRA